jgi:hypothetical protein
MKKGKHTLRGHSQGCGFYCTVELTCRESEDGSRILLAESLSEKYLAAVRFGIDYAFEKAGRLGQGWEVRIIQFQSNPIDTSLEVAAAATAGAVLDTFDKMPGVSIVQGGIHFPKRLGPDPDIT